MTGGAGGADARHSSSTGARPHRPSTRGLSHASQPPNASGGLPSSALRPSPVSAQVRPQPHRLRLCRAGQRVDAPRRAPRRRPRAPPADGAQLVDAVPRHHGCAGSCRRRLGCLLRLQRLAVARQQRLARQPAAERRPQHAASRRADAQGPGRRAGRAVHGHHHRLGPHFQGHGRVRPPRRRDAGPGPGHGQAAQERGVVARRPRPGRRALRCRAE